MCYINIYERISFYGKQNTLDKQKLCQYIKLKSGKLVSNIWGMNNAKGTVNNH